MRNFEVIVQKEKGSFEEGLIYPPQTGEEALRNMVTLEKRGFVSIAKTKVYDIEEEVTIEEMKEIFGGGLYKP